MGGSRREMTNRGLEGCSPRQVTTIEDAMLGLIRDLRFRGGGKHVSVNIQFGESE
jgi:hypothetical protein